VGLGTVRTLDAIESEEETATMLPDKISVAKKSFKDFMGSYLFLKTKKINGKLQRILEINFD